MADIDIAAELREVRNWNKECAAQHIKSLPEELRNLLEKKTFGTLAHKLLKGVVANSEDDEYGTIDSNFLLWGSRKTALDLIREGKAVVVGYLPADKERTIRSAIDAGVLASSPIPEFSTLYAREGYGISGVAGLSLSDLFAD